MITIKINTGTIAPYPTPEDIYLVEVSPAGLLFSWNQAQNCPSLRYNIQSENCGRCPNTTDGMSANCSDFSLSNSITLCNFSVETVTCGINSKPIVGNLSDPVIMNLTGKIKCHVDLKHLHFVCFSSSHQTSDYYSSL